MIKDEQIGEYDGDNCDRKDMYSKNVVDYDDGDNLDCDNVDELDGDDVDGDVLDGDDLDGGDVDGVKN